MIILAIDPSISKPGVALFERDKLISANSFDLGKHSKLSFQKRICKLINTIELWHEAFGYALDNIIEVVIEVPHYQYVDKNKKSIMLLHKTIGAIECYYMIKGRRVNELKVSEWKGNKSKRMTDCEMRLCYANYMGIVEKIPNSRRDNATDAIGIGDYFIRANKWKYAKGAYR